MTFNWQVVVIFSNLLLKLFGNMIQCHRWMKITTNVIQFRSIPIISNPKITGSFHFHHHPTALWHDPSGGRLLMGPTSSEPRVTGRINLWWIALFLRELFCLCDCHAQLGRVKTNIMGLWSYIFLSCLLFVYIRWSFFGIYHHFSPPFGEYLLDCFPTSSFRPGKLSLFAKHWTSKCDCTVYFILVIIFIVLLKCYICNLCFGCFIYMYWLIFIIV